MGQLREMARMLGGNPGIEMNEEEQERYDIFTEFFYTFVTHKIDEEINKRFPSSKQELEADEGLGDFIYSEYEDAVGQRWCTMMQKYLPNLWQRMEESRLKREEEWMTQVQAAQSAPKPHTTDVPDEEAEREFDAYFS